jgi:hypothetical protein
MGTTEDVKKLAEEYWEKQPKKKLAAMLWIAFSVIALLVSTIAGLWYTNYLKSQEVIKQQLQQIGTGQTTISTNQVEIYKYLELFKNDNERAHNRIILDQGEIRMIQGVVRKTLPALSKQQADQLQMIYDQMRKDQNMKDSKAMDESYIDPLEPELNSSTTMTITPALRDTLKKNSELYRD